ncbi:poly [ADP-ribose] polymerase 14-like [Pomacea canaliculata]|uniref:poly [ADP-ribose] polymerase 14-like n=1 Tax=Pomacea canaliculata TaxID=400727 RepID=UPI000D7389BE|nr:poly [ADP-ribose] polymerase 14-like [Pomacea canaliculata]XP_025093823.1 poly [ADP-ribose] polymerase 14-like [Pomacea canaliculata]
MVSRIMMTTIADYLEQVHSSLEIVKIVIFHDKEMELVFVQEHNQWYTQRLSPGVYGYMQSCYPHMSGKEYSEMHKERKGRGQRGRHGSETSNNQHYPQQQCTSHGNSAKVFSSHHSFQVESVKLTVKVGDITLEKCDMIVNSTNSKLDLTRGSVAKTIAHRCPHLQTECSKKKYKEQIKKTGLALTPHQDKLPFKRVLHVDLDEFLKNPHEMLYRCLERLRDTSSLCSIAFPLIGKGSGKMENPSVVGTNLAEAVVKFSRKPKQVKDVLLLVNSHELFPQVVEAVEKRLKSLKIIIQPPFKEKIKNQEQRKENKENIPYSSAVSHYSFTDPGQGHKPDQHNTLSRSQDAVSLFIFSDNKEMCQNAIDAIQCSITEQLEGTAQSHFTGNQSYVNLPPLVYPAH